MHITGAKTCFPFPFSPSQSWAAGTLEITVLGAAKLGKGPRVL